MLSSESFDYLNPSSRGFSSMSEMVPAGERVVSGYFAGQMAGMVLSGWQSRKTSADISFQSISFQQELNSLRNDYEKNKLNAELDFIRKCHNQGMKNQRDAALQSCIYRQNETEFKLFCDKIWSSHFRPHINAILEEMKNPTIDSVGVPKLKLLIARSPLTAEGIDKKGDYAKFCSDFNNDILIKHNIGMDSLWLRAWESDCVSAMSDAMNLHYIMQGLPTVVVFAIQRGDFLSIETATWAYCLGQSNMILDKTFKVKMSEISNSKDRLKVLMIAAAAYVDDCYRLFLHHSSVDSIYRIKELIDNDEMTRRLLVEKYNGLIAQCKHAQEIMLGKEEEIRKIENTIKLW